MPRLWICVIDMERELVNALNELWLVHDNLPYDLKVSALNYFDQFNDDSREFMEFDLTFIEMMVEYGYARGKK